MSDMEKIKTAIGQDDLFSCGAPLLHALRKFLRGMDLA
jgi:hypothetical protein